jgi:hypothetical protein
VADTRKLIKKREVAQDCCLKLATGGEASYEDYEAHRSKLVSEPLLQGHLPLWLLQCRYGSQFWSLMKKTSPRYSGRRKFIWEHFGKLIEFVENQGVKPNLLSIDQMLKICTSQSVSDAWNRCFERREHDPEGAITSARSMLESTCKHILDELGELYSEKNDLPKLYKKAANALSLSPDQHKEQIFKQILGGCGSVVTGLASLRNAFGDAHGKSKISPKPSPRHAELAINLAGSISSFLISTFEQRKT